MIGMTQAAWGRGSAALLDGRRAIAESLDRIVLVTIILLTCHLLFSISSTLLKQSLINTSSLLGVTASVFMLPITFAISLVVCYFLLYIGPSIIIGQKSLLTGCTESVKLVLQNSGITLTISVITFSVLFIGSASLNSNNFYNSQIFGLSLFLLIFSPSVCFINFLICGEYLNVRGFPASRSVKPKEKFGVVPRAITYIAAFSLLSVFSDSEIFAKTHFSSTYFLSRNGDESSSHLLENFIIETRSVKKNHAVERSAINDAYAMIVPHSDAYRYLEEWFPTHNPFTEAHDKIKFIYKINVRPGAQADTYNITWNEAVANPNTNAIKSMEKWEARVEVAHAVTGKKYFITQLLWNKR